MMSHYVQICDAQQIGPSPGVVPREACFLSAGDVYDVVRQKTPFPHTGHPDEPVPLHVLAFAT